MEISESIFSLLEQTNPGAFTISRLACGGMQTLYASPDAAKIVGMEQAEYLDAVRADTLSAILEEDRPIVAAAAEKCLRDGGDIDAVYRVRHKTKGAILIRAKGRIIGTMDGSPILYAVFYGNPDADVLVERNNELQNIVDNIPATVFIYKKQDAGLRIIYTNAYFRSLPLAPRLRLEAMDESGFLKLIHPDDHAEVQAYFAALFDNKAPAGINYRSLTGGDPSYRWLHLSGKPVPQPDGGVLVYAVFTDITAEKEAELRALKSQQMYRLMAEQAKQILFEYDQENRRIIYQMDNAYTRAICEAQGMPAVIENVPDSLVSMVDEPFRERFLSLFEPIDLGAPRPPFEYSTLVNGQTHWWRISSMPVTDGEGRVLTVYCSAQDITEMKREQQRYLDFFQSLDKAYPNNLGSFHLNLTKNICADGKSPLSFVMKQKASGTVDGYFDEFSKLIEDEETLAWFRREFTREALIGSYHAGKTTVSFPYSIRYVDGLRWRQGILVMHQNPRTQDIEAVTYAVDIDKQKRGEMLLQLMSGDGSDYIGFIDTASGTFVMHSGSPRCTGLESGQRAPYAAFLKRLAGYCAGPDGGDKLREQAALGTIMAALGKEKKHYLLYDFAGDAGKTLKKQVAFQWFDEEKSEVLVIQSDITDVWQTEQERLRRMGEAAVLNDTVSNVPVGIMVISAAKGKKLSLVTGNERIRRLLGEGYHNDELFFRHIHPDDAEKVRTAVDNGYASRLPFTVDYRYYPRFGGSFCWHRLMVNGAKLKNEEQLVYCCLFDITQEKAAEEARNEMQRLEVQKYETQLNMMASANANFAASYHLNLSKDQCTNMVVQDAAYERLGKMAESGTASGLFSATADTIPDAGIAAKVRDVFRCDRLLQKFEAGETKVSAEYPCRSVRGGVRWIRGSVNMVRNPSSGDVEGITYAVDIDDRKKTELVTSRIAQQEFEYIGILYLRTKEIELVRKKPHIAYPEVGCKVPYDTRRHFVQEHFVSPQEVDSYTRATDPERVTAELDRNGDYTFSYLQTDPAGKRACQQMRFSWLDQAHRIAMIVQTDVTASYEHEEKQIADIQSALMEAEKACSAKSDFVSRISHDIRTPIGAITNITDFAFEDIHDPEKLKDDLRKIRVSNEFLLSLVNDVLDISKIDSGKIELHPEPYLYADLVSSIQNMFAPLCESRGIRFVIDRKPVVPFIYIDHVRLNQIVMNLISNAVKYTPKGGTVTVSAGGGRRPDGQFDCVLTVSDTGIGMSREFQKTMFDPFTQEESNPGRDKSVQGTGLGLSLVKKLTDLMGGTIFVKSELGRGTEISVSFVAAEAHAGFPAADKQQGEGTRKTAGKLSGAVLLAEDNAINMEIAKRILESFGLRVVHAENGAHAVRLFSASEPGGYRAVLMDIQMPVMNGYDAAKAIRELNRPDAKSVPIIAMTADAFTAAVEHSRAVGMTDYVTKPIAPEVLFGALSKAMGGR
ncbi:MAG: PAS domain-containing protein [Oscillospiraceae bacterium]|nr:PAS domain-containing protein [Oscillospiraceae bacterium]